MSWQQIHIITYQPYVELVSNYLTLLGADAITWQTDTAEVLLEPAPSTHPLWQQVEIIALLTDTIDASKVGDFINNTLSNDVVKNYRVSNLADKNWLYESIKDWQARQFGNRLWVYPSWQPLPDAQATTLVLDPGLAFGTGAHPTTELCLTWLDTHINGGETIIDFGCGSGILALASLKLGAAFAYAIDHDPQALTATTDNAKRNTIPSQQLFIGTPEQLPSLQADIIIANIVANPLMELAPRFASLLKPGGKIALSGILASQAKTVSDHYAQWFQLNEKQSLGEWLLITGTAFN